MNSHKKYTAVFVPAIYPCTTGGLEIFYFHLVRELSKSNEIALFTACNKYINENCHIYRIYTRLFLIRKFSLGQLSIFISTFWKLLLYHKEVALIHIACTSKSGFYGYFFPVIKRIFGIPYIIQFHGGAMYPWKKGDGNRMLFRQADRIIAVSDTVKSVLERRTSRSIEVVLPLIPYSTSHKTKEILKKEYGFAENDRVLIMVGSIKPLKGNIYIYNEFKNLGREWIEKQRLKFLLVGKGSDSANLIRMIEMDDMAAYARLVGHMPNEKIQEIYCLADYYVIGSDFEGTPKSLIEALFHGLPVIATDVNGINSIIQDKINGLLVNKRQPGLMANAIKTLVENPLLADRLGKGAKESHQLKFDHSVSLSQLKRIYEEISRSM